jgi:hypothetical protein
MEMLYVGPHATEKPTDGDSLVLVAGILSRKI